MGNLFIGFPVPRAKIAEMIETAAPPIIHADRHEATGDDEISFLNLHDRLHASRHESGGDDEITIDGAGIATLYDDLGFHYKTFFPTLDGFLVTESGDGVVDRTHEMLEVCTGEATGSYANIKKITLFQLPFLTYEKNIFIRFRFLFNIFSDINGASYIITAAETNQKHIGISMYNNKLAYSCHDGAGRAQGTILECPGEDEEYEYRVEIKFYAGSRVEYWINETLLHTQTYRLPSGDFHDICFLKIAAANSNTTNSLYIDLSMLELYQPAT